MELAVLGIFTPAGSPSAAYLEPHVAGSYVIAGAPAYRAHGAGPPSTSPASFRERTRRVLERGVEILRVDR